MKLNASARNCTWNRSVTAKSRNTPISQLKTPGARRLFARRDEIPTRKIPSHDCALRAPPEAESTAWHIWTDEVSSKRLSGDQHVDLLIDMPKFDLLIRVAHASSFSRWERENPEHARLDKPMIAPGHALRGALSEPHS